MPEEMDTLFNQVEFDMTEIYLLKYTSIKAAMFWQFLSIKFSAVSSPIKKISN